MAYMNQDKKAKIKAELDKIMAGKGFKWSLSVRHHSTIVMTIKSGPMDFIGNFNAVMTDPHFLHYNPRAESAKTYIDVNPYHFKDHFTGKPLALIGKILAALNLNNHDNSDIMTDYFDVGHYVDLNIGKWDQPYVYNKAV